MKMKDVLKRKQKQCLEKDFSFTKSNFKKKRNYSFIMQDNTLDQVFDRLAKNGHNKELIAGRHYFTCIN